MISQIVRSRPCTRLQVAVTLLAIVGCKSQPKNAGELISRNPTVAASMAGIKTALQTIGNSHDVPKDATCDRAGMTFSTMAPTADGNAEMVWVDDTEIQSSVTAGPLGRLGQLGEAAEVGVAQPFVARAAATKQLLIIRENSALNADVFLIDLPAGTIACATNIDGAIFNTERPPIYDATTGDRQVGTDGSAVREAQFKTKFDNELAKRFGVPVRGEKVAAPSGILVAAQARYAKMVQGLADKAPACTEAEAPGTLQTTTLRLNVYAGKPLLAETDLNFLVELDEWISSPFRALVDPTKIANRDEIAGQIAAAPAIAVLDIPQGKIGAFAMGADGLESKSFAPGRITVRVVRFDSTGKATCQNIVELTNPAVLTINYNGMNNSKAMAVEEASIADFKKQLRTALIKP